MKTIFTSSFLPHKSYWMGQQTGTVSGSDLDNAVSVYNQAVAWVANTPNPSAWLGPSYYPQFQQAMAQAKASFDDSVGFAEMLDSGTPLSNDQNTEALNFLNNATLAWAIISNHPVPATTAPATPTTPVPPVATTPAGTPAAPSTAAQAITAAGAAGTAIAKAATPAAATPAKPAVPAVPTTPDMTTPLLIGGGITVAVILALVVSK